MHKEKRNGAKVFGSMGLYRPGILHIAIRDIPRLFETTTKKDYANRKDILSDVYRKKDDC